jgi:hypothetical protein
MKVEMRTWVAMAAGVAGVLLVVHFQPVLAERQLAANEQLAVADLLEFAQYSRAFAFDVNNGGFLSPDKMAEPLRGNVDSMD